VQKITVPRKVTENFFSEYQLFFLHISGSVRVTSNRSKPCDILVVRSVLQSTDETKVIVSVSYRVAS